MSWLYNIFFISKKNEVGINRMQSDNSSSLTAATSLFQKHAGYSNGLSPRMR